METHEQYSVRGTVHCEFRSCDIDDLDGFGKLEMHNALDSHPILDLALSVLCFSKTLSGG